MAESTHRFSKKPSKNQISERRNIGMSVREAGRKGGLSTAQNHSAGFFRKIGKKGGKRTAEKYRDLLSEFGKKGGRPRRPALDQHAGEEDQK